MTNGDVHSPLPRPETPAYNVFTWKLQAGLALTFPTPWGPTVFVRSRKDWEADRFLKIHEECHVRQLVQMGWRRYLWAHIWARIRTRSFYAMDDPIEKDCYDAEREARG